MCQLTPHECDNDCFWGNVGTALTKCTSFRHTNSVKCLTVVISAQSDCPWSNKGRARRIGRETRFEVSISTLQFRKHGRPGFRHLTRLNDGMEVLIHGVVGSISHSGLHHDRSRLNVRNSGRGGDKSYGRSGSHRLDVGLGHWRWRIYRLSVCSSISRICGGGEGIVGLDGGSGRVNWSRVCVRSLDRRGGRRLISGRRERGRRGLYHW